MVINHHHYTKCAYGAENTMTEDQIKADAISKFVNTMIGALEAGFIDTAQCNLAQIHRVAQHHVKDNYGIDLPHITEQWGDEMAKLCGHLQTDK